MSFKRGKGGKFAKGTAPGPGRPRGLHLRKVALDLADRDGVNLEGELWEVVQALLARAKEGDVSAAKLLFDRLADDHSSEQPAIPPELLAGPPAPTIEELAATAKVAYEVACQAVERAKNPTPADLPRVRRAPVAEIDDLGQPLPAEPPKPPPPSKPGRIKEPADGPTKWQLWPGADPT